MENPSSLFNKKRIKENSIHFEPGIHPTTQREVDSLHQAFANGDLDAHVWNTQVGERIASYAYDKPGLLVTIDSLAPNPSSSYPFFTPLQEATDVWISLPSRPNNLNHTNSVYVLKGDSLYYRLPQAILPTQKEPESIRKQMETLTATQEGAISQTLQSEIYGQATATLALGVVLWGASKLLEQKMSRRKFLSTGIAAGTTAFLGGEI